METSKDLLKTVGARIISNGEGKVMGGAAVELV